MYSCGTFGPLLSLSAALWHRIVSSAEQSITTGLARSISIQSRTLSSSAGMLMAPSRWRRLKSGRSRISRIVGLSCAERAVNSVSPISVADERWPPTTTGGADGPPARRPGEEVGGPLRGKRVQGAARRSNVRAVFRNWGGSRVCLLAPRQPAGSRSQPVPTAVGGYREEPCPQVASVTRGLKVGQELEKLS